MSPLFFGSGEGSAPSGLWSRSDLHTRFRTQAGRPLTDQSLTDARLDAYLTEAQAHWYSVIASIVPQALWSAPTKLTSADGGVTYTFGTDADGDNIVPIGHVELLEGPRGPVIPAGTAAGWDGFIFEGAVIRWPGQRARTFTDGPYARFVTPPGAIASGSEPTLQPKHARVLLLYRGLALWAHRTGRDPAPWYAEELHAWEGGTTGAGILSSLRTQYPAPGPRALDDESAGLEWWRRIRTE